MKQIKKYENKKILVMGLAKSGKAAATILKQLNAEVVVNDMTPLEENADAKEMVALGFEVVTGGHPVELLDRGFDYIFKNPGIPYRKVPLLMKAQELKIPILTEVQLAYDICEAPFIGITGTNGKTTTTTLIYEMLKLGNREPLIAGNIGEVASLVAQNAQSSNVLVTELSSFQLMGIDDFSPAISLLLNITEAHLDYHTDIEEYRQAKLNLIKNQTSTDFCVYNLDDHIIVEGISSATCQTVPFSLVQKTSGAYVQNNGIYFKDEFIIHLSEVLLKGDHNIQDILGAVAVCKLYGCATNAIAEVLKTFTGVKHRLQFVKEVKGVKYYNNSKATNMIATETSLKAFEENIILIAGGLDRGHDLSGLIPYFDRIKAIMCYGETKERIKILADEHNVPCMSFEQLDDCVKEANQCAKEGDIVLLSPACASWDQYKNFEIRGDHFIELVNKLTEV
ncbi:MAG TPA: UDP-N-acetylmuramoyl-L-alanine--D-glutamate ligase [Firmicutes bacterium]|nr:UDP-N-acetylmuramoyl-L-alanine--D-glutamate ligase [Bacillota bacterium]